MPKSYTTAAAFKRAIEDRLKKIAAERALPVNSVRLKFVIERMLARLFLRPDPPWLLKGGYAMELRYRPKARTTSDIDLTATGTPSGTLAARTEAIREELQTAVGNDLGDFLEFRIGTPRGELPGAPEGGARFPVEAMLAGKSYERSHIDVGFGDAVSGEPEALTGEDYLGFLNIEPARTLAIPRAQQFSEKVHAYTYPWTDRLNMRTKDLVDMLLLIEKGLAPDNELRTALHATFDTRNKQAIPSQLPPPPEAWQSDFRAMAKEVELSAKDIVEGYAKLKDFWEKWKLWER